MKINEESILNVIDFIEEHLTDELDLDIVANIAGYSKYHFHRMFSDIVGCTIYQYIKKRRLTEAANELIYTDKSIIDIALSSGYETQQSFTLAFKKSYMASPQVYRKNKMFIPIQERFEYENVNCISTYEPKNSNYSSNLNMIMCGGKAA